MSKIVCVCIDTQVDFIDKNGNPLFIENLVNAETSKTGALLAVDQTLLDSLDTVSGDIIDLVGHTIESEQPSTLNFMSYYGAISETKNYEPTSDLVTITVGATSGVAVGALLTASASLTGAAGYGATYGYFDTITLLGPTAVVAGVNASIYSTQAEFDAAVAKIVVGETYVPVQSIGVTSSINYARVA